MERNQSKPPYSTGERRIARRINRQLQARVGDRPALLTNISRTGLQMIMEPSDINAIAAATDDTGVLDLQLELAGDEALDSRCRVVWVNQDDEQCVLGLTFTGFTGEDARRWHNYVTAAGG